MSNEPTIVLGGKMPLDHNPQELVPFGNRSDQLLGLKVSKCRFWRLQINSYNRQLWLVSKLQTMPP